MTEEVITPQEMRARLARSYLESYRRAGIQHTEQEIHALAVADCELVDAARRNGELSSGPQTPDFARFGNRPTEQPIAEPIRQALEETNTRLAPDATPERIAVLHQNPTKVVEKWAYATARINRIIEGAGGAATIGGAIANAEYPKLAREYAELWAFFMTRHKPPPRDRVDHNPFRLLSDRDASRMFMRKVYDICDRSTGVLGSWWVK
jgi:hypothetical protein